MCEAAEPWRRELEERKWKEADKRAAASRDDGPHHFWNARRLRTALERWSKPPTKPTVRRASQIIHTVRRADVRKANP